MSRAPRASSIHIILVALASIALVSAIRTTATASPAREPWYRGPEGHRRVVHLSITLSLGVAYLATETVGKSTLAASSCRWCEPPGFDRDVRNALVWDDVDRARLLSSIDAYVLAPIVGVGLLIASDRFESWGVVLDDTLPVFETVAISQIITQAVKFSVGRQRPYAHFDPTLPPTNDDNASFWSGHSALGFAITSGAGMVCHWRHYRTEPYVWASGLAISLSTEYLRMAGDKHYLSDVVTGGLVGLASGLLIPRLMKHDLVVMPASNGAAIAGRF